MFCLEVQFVLLDSLISACYINFGYDCRGILKHGTVDTIGFCSIYSDYVYLCRNRNYI